MVVRGDLVKTPRSGLCFGVRKAALDSTDFHLVYIEAEQMAVHQGLERLVDRAREEVGRKRFCSLGAGTLLRG